MRIRTCSASNARRADAVAAERHRILVVDDNAFNLMLLRTLLSPRFEVAEAADARQALAEVARFRPHLVLLDLELPDMYGLTLARQLKADATTRDIRIVVLTAHAAESVEAAVRAAGCQGLLTKPVDAASFGDAMLSYLAGVGAV